MRRRRYAEVAIAGLLVGITTCSPAALAQDGPDAARIVVADLGAILGPGALPRTPDAEPPTDLTLRLLIENQGGTTLDNLRLVIETFGPLGTRSEVRAALDGRDEIAAPRTHIVGIDVRDNGPLEPGDIAGVSHRVAAEEGGWGGDRGEIHPVQLTLLRGTAVLDQVRTAVIYLPAPPKGILETVLVWPLSDAPWVGPDSVYPDGVDAAIQPGGRLDRLLRAAEGAVERPLLLAPAPHLVEDVRDRADGFRLSRTRDGDVEVVTVGPEDVAAQRANRFLTRLRDVAGALPLGPVVGPYADADVAALVTEADPLPAMAGTNVSEARIRIQRLMDRRPEPAYLSTSPMSTAALDLVPAEHLLLPWDQVDGPDLASDPTVDLPYPLRQVRTPAGRRLVATVADPWISGLLSSPPDRHGPVVAAHRVLVETATIHVAAPSVEGRPLLLLPPLAWDPPPRFPETLVAGLAAAPWLRLTDPAGQASRANRSPIPLTLAEGSGTPRPRDLATDLREAQRQLEAALAAQVEVGSTVGGRAPRALEDQLLRAPSRWFLTGRVDRARALIRDVLAAVDRAFGVVDVPVSARITLTSDRGTIPVTLQRPEGGPLRVRVEVDSQGRLAWPSGESQEIELSGEGAQTVSFETLALARGSFPVTVRVVDPTGRRVLEQTVLSVRTTAISRPALVVTGAVVLLLLLRGLFRRSGRRPRLEVVR